MQIAIERTTRHAHRLKDKARRAKETDYTITDHTNYTKTKPYINIQQKKQNETKKGEKIIMTALNLFLRATERRRCAIAK